MQKKYVVWFKEVTKEDIPLVGGKGANLGEMTRAGFPVPKGFIVTSSSYYYFLEENKLQPKIKEILATIDVNDPNQLDQGSSKIRQLINKGSVPKDLSHEIIRFYEKISGLINHAYVAVRSSATAEDLPDASFAGQQETYLNVVGEANLINKVREAWASLFTSRAIFYRRQKHFDHFKIGIAVPVQKMIQSEVSGVMFTIDPLNNDKSKIIIDAIWGLGELIVQGAVTPDHYEISRKDFIILSKQMGCQDYMLIKRGSQDKKVTVKKFDQLRQKLEDSKIIELAKIGKKLHQHYFFPQDIEWAMEKNKLYLVQTRPVTTIANIDKKGQEKSREVNLPILLKGTAASPGIASGFAVVIHSPKEIHKVKKGQILITEMTTPDFVPAMKKAVAIVTDKGGRVSHAAIVSRELGIPCVVGTETATKQIQTGMVVTVNGKTGEVYKGGINKSSPIFRHDLIKRHYKTKTKIYVNLGEPDLAREVSKRQVDGVGLLRAEFMISQSIGIHPQKLIKEGKSEFFINQLAAGLKTFCSAFHPRPVIYRATDFKTNEYRNLKGGKEFEPEEPNPMLGYRGAFRYVNNQEVFKLEIKAIKKVREKLGFTNLWFMIPFVRTVADLVNVKAIMETNGLTRSASFKLLMMAEIPSNVILLEDFLSVGIDGVSIGSNDLTMLILGVDRDNDTVASEFNERNNAVMWALQRIIQTCHRHHVTCSICGQAPSIYPEMTEKLVKWGITSISVSPDVIEKTREIVYLAEAKFK